MAYERRFGKFDIREQVTSAKDRYWGRCHLNARQLHWGRDMRTIGVVLVVLLCLHRPASTQGQKVKILVPLQQRFTITSTTQVLTVSEAPASGWEIEVYRNGLFVDSTQFGGADDFTVVGCCQIVPVGGPSIGDTYRLRFMVWRDSLVY